MAKINPDLSSFRLLLKAFPDEPSCIGYLEALRWKGNVVSPFDPTSKVYKCAGNKYRCKNTGKYFNVRTATLFDNTKIEFQTWFLAIYIVTSQIKDISSVQLAKTIGVTQKTAWFMLQRIRNQSLFNRGTSGKQDEFGKMPRKSRMYSQNRFSGTHH